MKTDNLVKALQSFGIRAAAYKKPPVAKDIFAVSIQSKHPEGIVTVNHGAAEVEIFGDKDMRQAAVSVTERGREVKQKVEDQMYFSSNSKQPDRAAIEQRLRQEFWVVVPGARWFFKNVTCVKRMDADVDHRKRWKGYWVVSGDVTAEVMKATVNHFLIGMDESHNFVAPLPKQAKSVMKAHALLKPRGVSLRSVRQGEWFFDPATPKRNRELSKIATSNWRRVHQLVLGRTTHIAQSTVTLVERTRKLIFARGYILDSRQGHHKSLFLKTWHRVIRNSEAKIKVHRDQRATARRRAATWD